MDLDEVRAGEDVCVDFSDDDGDGPGCPACGSHDFVYLGRLGRLEWLRCRNCGLDSTSQEIDPKCVA
jgi:hypothetical protein